MNVFTVAAAQYEIGYRQSWDDYASRIFAWVDAAGAADVLLFPEYFSLELASLFDVDVQRSLPRQLEAMQALHEPFRELFQGLSRTTGKVIQAGTFPVKLADGNYRNRAWLFSPDREAQYQDKIQMTRFEDEAWHISSGDEIKVLDSKWGRLGIAVCYDAEFPLIVRRMVELGAEWILVPSCTDTEAGYHRVKIGCQARALENQCYVIQAPTVGTAPWSPALDENIGAAAIYTPVDRGFPVNGILAIGEMNQPGWVSGKLDLEVAREVRVSGQVLNDRDWRKSAIKSAVMP